VKPNLLARKSLYPAIAAIISVVVLVGLATPASALQTHNG
jgi:hypothetical protein